MTTDHTPLGGFEARLLDELRGRFTTAAPIRATPWRRPAIYVAAGCAALAVVAGSGATALHFARDADKVELLQRTHVGPRVAVSGGWSLYVAANGLDWELATADLRALGRFEPAESSASLAVEGADTFVVIGVVRGAGDAPVELRTPSGVAVRGRAHDGYFVLPVASAPPPGSTIAAAKEPPVPVDVP
jgi:hypothetical protein